MKYLKNGIDLMLSGNRKFDSPRYRAKSGTFTIIQCEMMENQKTSM